MPSVILRSTNGPASFKTRTGDKDVNFDFTEKNNFECSVPTRWTFVDFRGQEKIKSDNYAQFLLDNYDYLELVRVTEEPPVVEKKEALRKRGRPPKVKEEESNEEV